MNKYMSIGLLLSFAAAALACSAPSNARVTSVSARTYGSGESFQYRQLVLAPHGEKSRYEIWYLQPGETHVHHSSYELTLLFRANNGRAASYMVSASGSRQSCGTINVRVASRDVLLLSSGFQHVAVSPADESIERNNVADLQRLASENRSDRSTSHARITPLILPACKESDSGR